MYIFRDKRGIELGWEFFFTLLFAITIIIILSVWIGSQASGSAIKKQILAKEICMVTTSAEPGTIITISTEEKFQIEKKDSGILIKENALDPGYFYDCYFKNIEISKKDEFIIIEIK